MSNKEIAEDEIDLIALIKSLWISRKKIFKITSLFLILGVLIALSSPVVYTASSTFIPQSNSSGGSSSLSGVASLIGINLGGNLSELRFRLQFILKSYRACLLKGRFLLLTQVLKNPCQLL